MATVSLDKIDAATDRFHVRKIRRRLVRRAEARLRKLISAHGYTDLLRIVQLDDIQNHGDTGDGPGEC